MLFAGYFDVGDPSFSSCSEPSPAIVDSGESLKLYEIGYSESSILINGRLNEVA